MGLVVNDEVVLSPISGLTSNDSFDSIGVSGAFSGEASGRVIYDLSDYVGQDNVLIKIGIGVQDHPSANGGEEGYFIDNIIVESELSESGLEVEIAPAHVIKFTGVAGVTYELQRSTNLEEWFNTEQVIVSDGTLQQFCVERMQSSEFYRVVEETAE